MKVLFLNYKEFNYYNFIMVTELAQKRVCGLDSIDSVQVSSVITRKSRYLDSSFVKLDTLLQKIVDQKPQLVLTTSFATLRSTITSSRLRKFLFFLVNYLFETGRFTLSPVSAVGNQANFVVRDYTYLANFLDVSYDFFGWKFPLRVIINFVPILKDYQFKFFFHLLILKYES